MVWLAWKGVVHMDSDVDSEVKMAHGCHHQGNQNKVTSFLQAFLLSVQHQHVDLALQYVSC